jgi:hypothetical protein
MHQSWVRCQHPSAQWNLRGGWWNSFEYSTKKNIWKIIIIPGTRSVAPISAVLKGGPLSVTFNRTHLLSEIPTKRPATCTTALLLGDGEKGIEIVCAEKKNILYWADKNSQGRPKISCTDLTSPTNQPGMDPFHFYSSSPPHLPQFQQSAGAIQIYIQMLIFRCDNLKRDMRPQPDHGYGNCVRGS